jgi:hypothetical protein
MLCPATPELSGRSRALPASQDLDLITCPVWSCLSSLPCLSPSHASTAFIHAVAIRLAWDRISFRPRLPSRTIPNRPTTVTYLTTPGRAGLAQRTKITHTKLRLAGLARPIVAMPCPSGTRYSLPAPTRHATPMRDVPRSSLPATPNHAAPSQASSYPNLPIRAGRAAPYTNLRYRSMHRAALSCPACLARTGTT